jgi:hypothetical protein
MAKSLPDSVKAGLIDKISAAAQQANAPEVQMALTPPVVEKGPAPIASVRWSTPQLAKEFAEVLAHRQRKGKSKNGSDLIEQMFNYLKKNPWGDFPTGR